MQCLNDGCAVYHLSRVSAATHRDANQLDASSQHCDTDLDTDVLVIGGGPAGSTAATFLARKGWRVLLVEKDRHPRFHIGESLLPMCMSIFDRLGVAESVKRIGVVKRGADFPAANERGYSVFRFSNMLRPVCDHAYQVKREEFDQLLFEHARAQGVQTIEKCRIEHVSFDNDRVLAQASMQDGATKTIEARITARYLVDASGRDTFLGSTLRLKKRLHKHQSAALFGHFKGVELRDGEDAGNISIYRFEHGWVWVIPLRDGVSSIGAVCNPEYLKQRTSDTAEFLLSTLHNVESLAQRLRSAQLVGNVHATGNYSYECDRWYGPRWLMVGDACAFLDPIFSTGVYLAMHGAECASTTVDAILRQAGSELTLQKKYQRELARGVKRFSWYIHRFTSPAMGWLFANPRNRLGVEQAMISMLAGDVFDSPGVLLRLHIFRSLYYLRVLRTIKQSFHNFVVKRKQMRAVFVGDTTRADPR